MYLNRISILLNAVKLTALALIYTTLYTLVSFSFVLHWVPCASIKSTQTDDIAISSPGFTWPEVLNSCRQLAVCFGPPHPVPNLFRCLGGPRLRILAAARQLPIQMLPSDADAPKNYKNPTLPTTFSYLLDTISHSSSLFFFFGTASIPFSLSLLNVHLLLGCLALLWHTCSATSSRAFTVSVGLLLPSYL